MEKCTSVESPSLITFSSDDDSSSDADSYNLYRGMQRIPYVPQPRNIVNPKRIFERVNDVAKGSTLEEYLKKIKHPIVTSTPINDASPTNPNSCLKLTPIPIRRNSIISGRFIGYKKRLSRKSLNNPMKKSKNKSKNKNRHSISDENSYQNDLNGIEPLNLTNKLIAEQEIQTTDSLNKSQVKLPNVQKETEILCDGTNKPIPESSASKIQEKFTFHENLANSLLVDLDNVILLSSTMENTLQNKSIQNEKSVVDNFNSKYNIVSNIPQVSVRILRSASRLLNQVSDVSNRNETFTVQTKSTNRYKKITKALDCTKTYKEETVNAGKDISDLIARKKSKNGEISPVSIREDDENKNKKKRQVRRTKLAIKDNKTPDQRELTRTDRGKNSQSTNDVSGLQAKPSSPIKTNKNVSQSKETIEKISKGIVVGKKTNSLNLPEQSSYEVHEVVEVMTPNEDDTNTKTNTKKYKRKTNLKGTNKTNNKAAQNSIPIELQKYIVSQSGSCDSRSVEPDNEGTFRTDPRLRRTIKPRVPYIQAIFISPKRKPSIAKIKKSNKRTSKASNNNNTTKTKNLKDLVETEEAASTNSETIARTRKRKAKNSDLVSTEPLTSTSNTCVTERTTIAKTRKTTKNSEDLVQPESPTSTINTIVSATSKGAVKKRGRSKVAMHRSNTRTENILDVKKLAMSSLLSGTFESERSTITKTRKRNAKNSEDLVQTEPLTTTFNTDVSDASNLAIPKKTRSNNKTPPRRIPIKYSINVNNLDDAIDHIDEHLSRRLTTSESNKEECFKKPKGRAMRKPKVRADTSNLQTTSISTIHEPNDTYLPLSLVSDEAVDNIDNQDKTLTRDDCTYNLMESKSTRIPAGKNKSGVQTFEHLNPEAKRKKVIQTVVDNSSVMLEWYSDIPSVGDTQSVNVLYSLTNLRSHINNVSCGFVIFGPSQEKSQIPSKHVILFKIEKGRALVSQQLVSVEMNPEQSFYVPLGSAYRIKNLSDSETLVLYFAKMAK
ncbi:hypothetical protein RN001_000048 [Aquatica leii]|uniref:Uncharacterized protein n=1 Tax=Aquatica leii TaxID=1421715 RepID=A0AAN7Q6Q1_9COLE|nr:hypothetical protein RN001_000048 [Aquatica leii]